MNRRTFLASILAPILVPLLPKDWHAARNLCRNMTFDPKTGTYKRTCKYCEAEMNEPLSLDGKLWMFCCPEHKKRWDNGQRTIRELEKDRTRFL